VNAVNEVDEVALFRKDQITLHSQRLLYRCSLLVVVNRRGAVERS